MYTWVGELSGARGEKAGLEDELCRNLSEQAAHPGLRSRARARSPSACRGQEAQQRSAHSWNYKRMTHVCLTPPQPVLHRDCMPNLSPPSGWSRTLPLPPPGRQLWHGRDGGGTATGAPKPPPSVGSCSPCTPTAAGTDSRTPCPAQAPGGGERPRKPQPSAAADVYLSSAGSSCSAQPTAWERSREVSGVGAPPGSAAAGARRFQQGCLAAACTNNQAAAARRRKMRTAQLRELFKASVESQNNAGCTGSAHRK